MRRKRIFIVGLICFVMFFILISRLVYIQLLGTESFSKRHVNLIQASIEQRAHKIVLDSGRGKLLDRNGIPFRNQKTQGLILFPFVNETDWPIEQIADILGADPTKLRKAVENAVSPFIYSRNLTDSQMEEIQRLHVQGVYVFPVQSKRFNPIAEHILGLAAENPELVRERYPQKLRSGLVSLNTKIGISGLEKAFDPFLLSKEKTELVYFTKATGAPMFGYHVELKGTGNPYYPLKVRTTLDKRLQQILENDVDQAGLSKGGAVLLKADNSNLLAMVNRPLYDTHHPYATGGKNYMVLPQIPGSVFKMVTAAAAIEKNAVDPNRLYDCNRTVYGEEGATRQLGKLTFLQSFAQSCNHTFAVTANELIVKDHNYMERYAEKLGLIGPVGWKGDVDHEEHFRQIPEEEAGLIWEDSSYKNNPKSVAQTAIGQLNVRVSPLAMANAMATIARGGKKLAVRAADEVDYANGVKLIGFPAKELPGGRITPYTAMELQKFLSKVVDSPEGTGHILSGLPFDVAGKSGTAETGTGVDNHWFAGYFPASDPQYVLVVVNLDRHAGDMKTYQIYKQVVKDLYNLTRSD